MTRTIELERLASGVQRGYLCYAGQTLGVAGDGRDLQADSDLVILEVHRRAAGWAVTYRVIEVRPGSGFPA